MERRGGGGKVKTKMQGEERKIARGREIKQGVWGTTNRETDKRMLKSPVRGPKGKEVRRVVRNSPSGEIGKRRGCE